MLAVAVTSGSLHELLAVVIQLLQGQEAMPANSRVFLSRLAQKTNPLMLSMPSPGAHCGEFIAKANIEIEKINLEHYESEVCADGSYLFVWNGLDASIRKIGTGLHGTIAGNEYMFNNNVLQQLSDRLGVMVYEIANVANTSEVIENAETETTSSTILPPTPAVRSSRHVRILNEHSVIFDIEDYMEEPIDLDDILTSLVASPDGETLSSLNNTEGEVYEILEERTIEVDGHDVEMYRIGEYDWIPSALNCHMPASNNSDLDSDDSNSDDGDSYSTFHDTAVAFGVQAIGSSGSVTAAGNEHPGSSTSGSSCSPHRQGWLACVNGKLYLRLMHLLGPFRVAVFSCSALKLEAVEDISFPIPEFLKAKKIWQHDKCNELLNLIGKDDELNSPSLVHNVKTLQEELDSSNEESVIAMVVDNVEEFEYSSEALDLLADADTPSPARLVMASSNFVSSNNIVELNLLAPNNTWNSQTQFIFDGDDDDQELIVDLGDQLRVTSIGSLFTTVGDNAVEGKFEIFVSNDGSEYVSFGSAERDSFADGAPTILQRPSDEDSSQSDIPKDIRYIRLKFGEHPSSSKGSAISRILVQGLKKSKKVTKAPFLAMTSDGHRLLFVQCMTPCIDHSRKENMLKTFIVDPVNSMSVVSEREYSWGGLESEAQLHKCSFIYNSSLLIVSHPKDFLKRIRNKKEISYSFHRLDCETGRRTTSCDVVFNMNKGVPAAVTYDPRNNFIWGWDAETLRFLRWRNVGLPPSFLGMKPNTQKDMLMSPYPQYRIESLLQDPSHLTDPKVEAALILSQLDRLSLPFSPPALPRAESNVLNEIEVCSGGYDDGNYGRILIRGQDCCTCSRGFNMLTLNSHWQPKDFRNFDTHGASQASDRMADFMDTVPDGTIVLVAVMDSAHQHLTTRGKAALSNIGARNIEKLGHRGSLAIIGKKGDEAVKIKQKMTARRQGDAIVRQRIPLVKAPLCYECESSTIHSLVTLIVQYHSLFRQDTATAVDNAILISSMRLLMTNIFQLLEGTHIDKALKIFNEEDRNVTVRIVKDLIEHPSQCEGGFLISEVALRLFIHSIDVLYPTPGEKCSLLVGYLDAFVNDSISELERSVLELLLRQMSVPSSLIKLFYCSDNSGRGSTSPAALIDSLLSIAKKDTFQRLENVSSLSSSFSQNISGGGTASVGEASIQMLSIVCNLILSQSAQVIVCHNPPPSTKEDEALLVPLVNKAAEKQRLDEACDSMLILVTKLTEACTAILNIGKSVNDRLTQENKVNFLDDEIDFVFKNSLVGALLPTIFNTTALLYASHGQKIIPQLLLHSLDTTLYNSLNALKAVLSCIPQEKLQPKGTGESSTTRSSVHVYESEHPYQSNVDEYTELNFPNALRMTFTFDEQTRTEHNYDWLKIWKDSSKTELVHPSVDKFSGRNGSENWPGFGGRAPLIVEGSQAYLEFHSDSSNEDWGYRVNVQVEYKRKVEARIHWMLELEHQLAYCGSVMATSMIVSAPWNAEKEDRNAYWMENSLLKSGFRDEDETLASDHEDDEMTFLKDFLERPDGSLAASFCKIMKSKVIEDKGQVDEINRAVYVTCAALLRHKNVVSEAMAVADGTVLVPSEGLVKIWKIGQKMRTFFDFGDLKNASPDAGGDDFDDLPPPPAMERGPSIYSGAETLVIKAAADRVITRALFLLRVNSAAKTAELVQESANRTWTSAFEHQESKEKAGWDSLVGQLQSAYKLKGMLDYRRSALKRVKNSHLTTTEKVLRFVQGFAVVEELEFVRSIRNNRARVRAQGFDMITSLLESASTPFSVKWLMLSFSRAMRATCHANRPHQHVHYLNAIEGCSQKERSTVIQAFCGFVEKCVYMMNKSFEKSHDGQLPGHLRIKWREVTVSCLRALAIDYDMLDHTLLDKSNVLSSIQFFLQNRDDTDVYRTALSLFELLLPRCVGLEGQMSSINSMHEPSELNKKLVALLVNELDRTSQMVTMRSQPILENDVAISLGSVNLISKTMQLRKDCMGYTAPHVDMGLQHSIAFWFKRQRRPVDTLFTATEPLTATQMVGNFVIQGPDWNVLQLDNGHEDNIGTVMSYDEETQMVKVKWSGNKNTGTYKYGKIVQDVPKFEVILADPNINGHIYSKGMRALLSEDDRAYVWSTFGLQLTADARLMMFATKDEDGNFRAKSKSRVPADAWTHVCVIQDVKTTRLFINGELDCETLINPSMLYPIKGVKEKEIVESPHPYHDNTSSYTEVAIEGAISYTITFDPRTRTEQGHDYIRFYKDSNHSDYWGSDKYSGGRSGSRSNWPGCADNPPLIIPASKFVVYFKSDGSNNDWGYRITCIAEKNNVYDDSKPMIDVLNTMPFYIGQTPTYVDNLPSTPSATGFISDFNVFGKKAITPEEVQQVMAVSSLSSRNGIDDEVACLDILGIMTKSQMSLTGFTSSLLNNAFVGPNILYPLFNILANGTGHAQISSVRVCASLLCVYPIDMIDAQAKRVGLVHNDSFLSYLFNRVGSVKNAYYSRNIETSQASLKARFCNELNFAIGLEYLTLLSSLLNSEHWSDVISTTIVNVLETIAPRVIQEIARQSVQETILGFSSNFIGVDSNDLNMLLVVLGLCGGGLTGLYMGSSARCTVGDDNGIIEDCTILNAAWPPSKDDLDAMVKAKDVPKSEIDMWKDKTCFTDAFYVVLKSQPTKPLLVPRDKVNIDKCSVSPALSSLVSKHSSKFVALFESLSAMNCADMRPKHLPRVEEKDVVKEFESEHPYLSDSKKSVLIEIPGASSISISFDRRTRTEPNTTYVTFFKDESNTDYWGEAQYGGRDASQNWPGINGRKPLVIPTDHCILHFKSEGSNSDWGYKFTASAHCVVKTFPPERPPLLHNAIAGHIKILGMTALHALLKEFSWFSLHCMPILGPLVSSALSPLPSIKLDMARVKPVMMESKHPYDHNMDEYYTVRVSGAKKLKVVFDEQTCTENGADYLRFYKDDSHSDVWGDNQYTGGKDGGSSNWPGMQGRDALIIPTNSFVIYFKTDGSVNAWGYKIYITAVNDEADAVPNMDSTLCSFRAHCNHMVIRDCRLSQAEPDGLELFETEPVCLAACGGDVSTVALKDSSDLSDGDKCLSRMDKVISKLNGTKQSSLKKESMWCKKWPKHFCINEADARCIEVHEHPDSTSMVVFEAGLSSIIVADEEQGDWLHVSIEIPSWSGNTSGSNGSNPSEDQSRRDAYFALLAGSNNDSSEAPTTSDSPLLPSEVAITTTRVSGWILRRQGDLVFVVPENGATSTSALSSQDRNDWINLDDILSSGSGSNNPSSVDKHPMYDVDESTLADVYGTNHMQPTPVEVLQSESRSPERCAVEMCQLGSIALSQDCISEILSLWPKDISFSLDCFGSIDSLMQYIRAAYMRDITAGKVIGCKGSRLDALRSHILTAIRLSKTQSSDEGELGTAKDEISVIKSTGNTATSLCDSLMKYSIAQLSKSLLNEKALRPTMGKLFIVESKHPYEDNMDEFWDVHIPGASSLKLVFDSRTSTEKDCDYVTIHNDRNKSVQYGQRFTGRKRNSDKVWPGLGSVQPLVVPGDKCVVYFHSDSSNTDWGFKLKCYGVMEEPTDEERDQHKEQQVSPDRPFADLACWMLEFLAKEPLLDVYRNLYSASTIATLRRYMEVMPARKKCFAIHLLTNMLQEIPRIPLGLDVREEVYVLKNVISTLISTQYNAEHSGSGSGGGGTNTSQLLQALIQAAIVLDNCLTFLTSSKDIKQNLVVGNVQAGTEADSIPIQVSWSSTDLPSSMSVTDENSILTCVSPVEGERCAHFVLSGQGFDERAIHTFYLKVNSVYATSGLRLGLVVGDGNELQTSVILDGAGTLTVTVRGKVVSEIQQFGLSLQSGDVIAIDINLPAKTIIFLCNHALVGTAVGPFNSGAACEIDLSEAMRNMSLHLCASLSQPGEALQLCAPLPAPLAPVASISSLVHDSEWPAWFNPIREAVTLLKACYARELPTAVLMRDFLPACEESWSANIQSSHPFDGRMMNETVHIPHAESLTVRFHASTKMGNKDVIVVRGNDNFTHEFVNISSGTELDENPNSIAVGDRVVRGPAWDWGDQDGGAGGLGIVTEVTTWKGQHNAGVMVKWDRSLDYVGLYRWDFEGLFDLLVVGRSDESMKPLKVPGDTLHLEVIPGAKKLGLTESEAISWNGALYFNGRSSFLQPPLFSDFDMSADLTVEAWIKVATNIPPTERCLPIFSRQIEVDEKITQFALQLGTIDGDNDTNVLVMEAANTQMQQSFRLRGGVVTPGVWTHVCGVVSGSMTAILINGTVVATSNSFTGTRLGALGAPLFIGKSAENAFFKGNMFDIRMWRHGRPIVAIKEEKDTPVTTTPGIVCALGCAADDIIMGGPEGMINDSVLENGPTQLCDVLWDDAVEPNILPENADFGFICTVTPTFSLKTLLSESVFAKKLMRLQCQYTIGEMRHDLALVRYINSISRTRKIKIEQLLRSEWTDIAPTNDELSAMPLLKELMNMNVESTIAHLQSKNAALVGDTRDHVSNDDGGGAEETKGPTREEAKRLPEVSTVKSSIVEELSTKGIDNLETSYLAPIQARFNVLKLLNKALSETIQYIDLCMIDKTWSVANLLTLCRGLVFEVTKTPIWETALDATASNSSSKFDMRLSRSRAAKHKRTGLPDNEARWMVFSQAFRQMHTLAPSTLRRSDQLFYTTFAGERAHDAGGPYREAFAMMYLELQSPSLPLLIRTPNGRHSVGQNREKWILNPSASSSLHMDMYSFLGKLMGIAIRSKEYMELNIPSIIWKLLVQEVPNKDDLEAIDLFQIQSLDNMRNIHLQGITRESFSFTFYETFTTMSTDDRMVELVTGGEEKNVDFDNRNQYCDLVEQYRLHEFDAQAAAIRRGLASIIPHRLLSLYTWDQLEVMVCGSSTIDINLLKSVTEYSSCSSTDTHIQYFWQILDEFSEEERSTFLRFVWGRSRLPLTADGFTQRFKLQLFGKQPADQYLPVAHTCFFSLEFPSYSSLEVAKEKLRYAIYNCQAIDGDDTSVGMQAAALGWEE